MTASNIAHNLRANKQANLTWNSKFASATARDACLVCSCDAFFAVLMSRLAIRCYACLAKTWLKLVSRPFVRLVSVRFLLWEAQTDAHSCAILSSISPQLCCARSCASDFGVIVWLFLPLKSRVRNSHTKNGRARVLTLTSHRGREVEIW